MRKILLIPCIVILGYSCSSHDLQKSAQHKMLNNIADTFVRDIPDWMLEPSYMESSEKLEQLMGLPSLKSGFQEFQIRFWVGNLEQDTQQTIIIKKYNSKWRAEFYHIALYHNNKGQLESVGKRMEIKEPKSGWKPFVDSLMSTGVQNLQDYFQISGYRASTHGAALTVEIATPELYRIYRYPDIDLNAERFTDPARLVKALMFIESEFDYKVSGIN